MNRRIKRKPSIIRERNFLIHFIECSVWYKDIIDLVEQRNQYVPMTKLTTKQGIYILRGGVWEIQNHINEVLKRRK